MFVRTKTTPNSPRKSVQVVENERDSKTGKVKQRILRHVGIAFDEIEEEKLRQLALELIEKIELDRRKNPPQLQLFDSPIKEEFKDSIARNTRGRKPKKRIEEILPITEVSLDMVLEEARIIDGVHEVVGHLYDFLGFRKLLGTSRYNEILRDLTLSRISQPKSKHATCKILRRYYDKEHDLDAIYRTMDQVYKRISNIKQAVFTSTSNLFSSNVDLLLFDVTTLHFESTDTDELREFGYSKNFRFNTTQVVLALATNADGLPIGYELFEGNKAEVSTLMDSIESWKKLFAIESVCFVGDRAMFSKHNISRLESLNYQYIIAAKLKALPAELKIQVLDEQHYKPTILNQELAWIGEFEYQGQRLISSYKSRRAMKDQQDRLRVLDKVQKVIGKRSNPKKLITNQGVKKFVSVNDDAMVTLDQNKIEDAAQWDGLHGIITNIRNDAPGSLIARYAKLWIIEESFRVNKHTLQMRPIFHWAPPRIHAHIAICYMTFSVLRHLQYRVNLTQKISIDTILDELMNVQASIYLHKKTKDRYRVPGSYSNNARKIYRAFECERSLDAKIHMP